METKVLRPDIAPMKLRNRAIDAIVQFKGGSKNECLGSALAMLAENGYIWSINTNSDDYMTFMKATSVNDEPYIETSTYNWIPKRVDGVIYTRLKKGEWVSNVFFLLKQCVRVSRKPKK